MIVAGTDASGSVVTVGVPSWLYIVGVQAGGWHTPPAPTIIPPPRLWRVAAQAVALNRFVEERLEKMPLRSSLLITCTTPVLAPATWRVC